MTDQPKNSRIKAWQIIVGGIIVIILASMAIPSVRASISSFLGLSVSPKAEVTTVSVTLEPVFTSTPDQAASATETTSAAVANSTSTPASNILPLVQSGGSAGGSLEISRLSSQLGWNVMTPTFLPEGYQYQSAYLDTNNNMLVLTYLVTRPLPGATDPTLTSSETITLLEAQKNDFVPMQIAPNTSVQDVQVNGAPAAFTTGGWDTQFVKDNNEPGGGKMVSSWRNDLPVKNLYWQVGKVYLALVTADELMTQQDLVNIASSIGK